jgi:nicotinate dehydrogenase subunit A
MSSKVSFRLNGRPVMLEVEDPQMPLLYALRDDYGLHGPRFGCGLAQCGACTVHLNGSAARSCVIPISAAAGTSITTLEGLGTPEKPHPLQRAFVEEQALQCGYCINGMIMQAADLLQRKKNVTEADIKAELANNLCRCGTHLRIVRAIKRASS